MTHVNTTTSTLASRLIFLVTVLAMGFSVAKLRAQEELIVSIDRDSLVGDLIPGAVASDAPPRFIESLVSKIYHDQESGVDIDVRIGIFNDAEEAKPVHWKMMPQLSRYSLHEDELHGWVTTCSCNLRFDNAVVVLLWNEPIALDIRQRLLDSLVARMRNKVYATRGLRVNVPAVDVYQIVKLERGQSKYDYADIFFSVEEGDLLVAQSSNHRTKRAPNGRNNHWVTREMLHPRATLHVARPTGEVAAIRVSRVIEQGVRVVDEVELETSAKDRTAMVEKVRHGTVDLKEQSQIMVRLAEQPVAELDPFFKEVIGSTRSSPLKAAALDGLANLRGAEALDFYRALVTDTRQPDLVRRDAIRLVAKHGDANDIALLEKVRQEENENLNETIYYAVYGLKGEIPPGEK